LKDSNVRRCLIFFDEHGIFVDIELLKLRVQFMSDLNMGKNDILVLGGDNVDNYCISDFKKSMRDDIDVNLEATEFKSVISMYDNVIHGSKKKWILGNHEIRHEKNICDDRLKPYATLKGMQFNEIFGVDKYNIDIIQDHFELVPNFIITHGECGGKYPARAEISKYLCSGISGHSHKRDHAFMNGYKARIEWFSCGHLADKSLIDMNCKYSLKLNWNRSFAFILFDEDRIIDIENIPCDQNYFYSRYLRREYGKRSLAKTYTR